MTPPRHRASPPRRAPPRPPSPEGVVRATLVGLRTLLGAPAALATPPAIGVLLPMRGPPSRVLGCPSQVDAPRGRRTPSGWPTCLPQCLCPCLWSSPLLPEVNAVVASAPDGVAPTSTRRSQSALASSPEKKGRPAPPPPRIRCRKGGAPWIVDESLPPGASKRFRWPTRVAWREAAGACEGEVRWGRRRRGGATPWAWTAAAWREVEK